MGSRAQLVQYFGHAPGDARVLRAAYHAAGIDRAALKQRHAGQPVRVKLAQQRVGVEVQILHAPALGEIAGYVGVVRQNQQRVARAVGIRLGLHVQLSAAGVAISHLDAVVEVHEAYAVARVQVNHRRLGKAVAQKSEYRKFGVYIVLAELQLDSGRRSFPHAVHLP